MGRLFTVYCPLYSVCLCNSVLCTLLLPQACFKGKQDIDEVPFNCFQLSWNHFHDSVPCINIIKTVSRLYTYWPIRHSYLQSIRTVDTWRGLFFPAGLKEFQLFVQLFVINFAFRVID